jgi:hypothetical protein
MGEAARERFEDKFTASRMQRSHEEIYEALSAETNHHRWRGGAAQ